jgi:multicomponent K+:H+ antiporter subunit C
MLALFCLFIGALGAGGTWLLLRARTFDVVLGLTLLSYAVNLFIFAMGRVRTGAFPIVPGGMQGEVAATLANTADPLPQALVLTAIVISFAMTALLLAIAIVARAHAGHDHVDGDTDADAHAHADAPGAPVEARR